MTDNNQQLDEHQLSTNSAVCDSYDHGQMLSATKLTPLHKLTLQKVDANYPKLQLGIAAVIFGILSIIITLLVCIIPPIEWLIKGSISIITILLALWVIRLIYLKACHVEFGVFSNEFVMRSGLFWISTTALPYTRLQHVNLSQGPLERKFNLITLKCFSAGSGEAEIDLPGLNATYAEHLRQHLLQQAAELQQASPIEQQTASDSPATNIEPVVELPKMAPPMLHTNNVVEGNDLESNELQNNVNDHEGNIPDSNNKRVDNNHAE